MLDIKEEIKRLVERNPELRKELMGVRNYIELTEAERAIPRFGTVVANQDPRQLGRVRVSCPTIAPGVVTPWIPVLAIGATKNSGWWQIPDIGTQVIMAFVGKGHSKPCSNRFYMGLEQPPAQTFREGKRQ